MNITYTCKKCGEANDADYDIGEHFCDLYECQNCGAPIPIEDFADLEIQAMEKLYDRADMMRDR